MKEHYRNILNGRDLTKQEIIAEAKNLIRKWDDAIFLVNCNWHGGVDKEDWEKIAEIKY